VHIPAGLDGEAIRTAMRAHFEIEIGTAFGPLQGKIWRLGAMGYNAMKHKVLLTLSALEACLMAAGHKLPLGAAVPAAIAAWEAA
jgi:(S)-ureidoglycine-glyoxylate aminotransferase